MVFTFDASKKIPSGDSCQGNQIRTEPGKWFLGALKMLASFWGKMALAVESHCRGQGVKWSGPGE